MVGPDLDQLFRAALLVQPVGESAMEFSARILGQARVGNVANQDVLKAICALAGGRGAAFRAEQLARHELVKCGFHRRLVLRQRADRTSPKHAPDYGAALNDGLAPGRQRSEEHTSELQSPVQL